MVGAYLVGLMWSYEKYLLGWLMKCHLNIISSSNITLLAIQWTKSCHWFLWTSVLLDERIVVEDWWDDYICTVMKKCSNDVNFPHILRFWHFSQRLEGGNSSQIAWLVVLHSSPKKTQLFWSCLSFGEECRSVNFGPNFISLGAHDLGSLTLVQGHLEKSGN